VCSSFPSQFTDVSSENQHSPHHLSPDDLISLSEIGRTSQKLFQPHFGPLVEFNDEGKHSPGKFSSLRNDVIKRLKLATLLEILKTVLENHKVSNIGNNDVVEKVKNLWRNESNQVHDAESHFYDLNSRREKKRIVVRPRLSPFGTPLKAPSLGYGSSKQPFRYGRRSVGV